MGKGCFIAAHITNLLPAQPLQHISLHFKLYNITTDYSSLHTFGCTYFPHLPIQTSGKFHPIYDLCIFLGYPSHTKGYKCYNPITHKIIISRNVIFDETIFPFKNNSLRATSPTLSKI